MSISGKRRQGRHAESEMVMKKASPKRLRIFLFPFLVAALLVPSPFFSSRAAADWSGGHCGTALPGTSTSWYFAEGTTRPGFDEWLCVLNPNGEPCALTFHFLSSGGEGTPFKAGLAPHSRFTLNVKEAAGAGLDVSVQLDSDRPVAAERAMYFRYGAGGWTGGHCEHGAVSASEQWLFAEGTTRAGFDTWLSISNPQDAAAKVEVAFLLGAGQGDNHRESYLLGPRSRFTLRVNDVVPPECDVSLRVVSDRPVVAERPVYFLYRGAWDGGHDALGSCQASTRWYFAEGTTQRGFEEWICLLNPQESDARATLTFMSGGGELRRLTIDVPAQRRVTVSVGEVVGPEMDVSCEVSSREALVAERPMYFSYQGRYCGGHISAGCCAPISQAFFAEGCTRAGFDEYICVLNPNDGSATIQATFMDSGGAITRAAYGIGGRSRLTLSVRDIAGVDKDVSLLLESDLPVVVERPMYFSYRCTAPVMLAAVGDVNLDLNQFRQGYDYGYPWTGVAGLLQAADLAFANLECTVSFRGSPVAGKAFTFRGSPNALPAARAAGIDVVSHANNHARDFGTEALLDSFFFLDSSAIARCGSGMDYAAAHAPAFLCANGLRVAFLAYNDIDWPGWTAGAGYPGVANATNVAGIASDIAAARESSDLVVASFHWGTEREYAADQRQRELAHFAIDCGADLVLGHHPHVIQGFEIYKGKLIAYSLGNFVFNPGSPQCNYTVLAHITLDAGGFRSAVIYPALISNGRPALMGGTEAVVLLRQVAALSAAMGTPMNIQGDTATIP
jgi:poly-gamma-glutamate capsule biosynthesis protein CapA/YwtB (metallophosphatase superfamily)